MNRVVKAVRGLHDVTFDALVSRARNSNVSSESLAPTPHRFPKSHSDFV